VVVVSLKKYIVFPFTSLNLKQQHLQLVRSDDPGQISLPTVLASYHYVRVVQMLPPTTDHCGPPLTTADHHHYTSHPPSLLFYFKFYAGLGVQG